MDLGPLSRVPKTGPGSVPDCVAITWVCPVPATKDSGSKEVGDQSLVLDNYEDKDPDCGSALT